MRAGIVCGITILLAVGCNKQPPPSEQANAPPQKPAPVAGETSRMEPPPAPAPGIPAPSRTPAPAPRRPEILPAETTIQVRTTTRLSTETNKPGDVFTATLEEPLTSQGRIVAPKGSTVEGRVVEADKGGRVEGVAHIGVTIARVVPSAGRPIEIETSTYTV